MIWPRSSPSTQSLVATLRKSSFCSSMWASRALGLCQVPWACHQWDHVGWDGDSPKVPLSYPPVLSSAHQPILVAGRHVEQDVPLALPPGFSLQCDAHYFTGCAHHLHLQAEC